MYEESDECETSHLSFFMLPGTYLCRMRDHDEAQHILAIGSSKYSPSENAVNLVEIVREVDMVYDLGRDSRQLFTIELTRAEWDLLPRNKLDNWQRLALHYALAWYEDSTISWDGHPFVYIAKLTPLEGVPKHLPAEYHYAWRKIGLLKLADGIDHGSWNNWCTEEEQRVVYPRWPRQA